MNKAIIVDIDGTLADCSHRLHHIKKTPKDWKAFHDGVKDDKVNEWCKLLLNARHGDSENGKWPTVLLVSGRVNESYIPTQRWLNENDIWWDDLFMREKNDYRNDVILKREIYEKHIEGKYEVLFVLEDRKRTVDMWRSLGLTVLQCAAGEF